MGSLVAACELLAVACGIWFLDQGSNPGLLHWELGVLATGPSGKSLLPSLKQAMDLCPSQVAFLRHWFSWLPLPLIRILEMTLGLFGQSRIIFASQGPEINHSLSSPYTLGPICSQVLRIRIWTPRSGEGILVYYMNLDFIPGELLRGFSQQNA